MTKKIIRSFPKVVCSNISTKGTLSGFTSRFVTKSAAKGGNNRFLDPSFEGKSGQVAIDFARRTMAVGVGKGNIAEYQQATRTIVTTARDRKIAAVNIQLPKKMYASLVEEPSAASLVLSSDTIGAPTIAQTVSAAAVMASYHYGRTKTSPAPAAPKLVLTGNNNEAASEIDAGTIVGNAVNDARTLGNLRPDEGSPQFYEQWMRKHIATLPGVSIRHVIRGDHLKRQGLNLMHAVGRSAVREPVLVVLEYRGDKKSKTSTALVGKGLTFDCGGMNVKPYGSMESMHQDMMGAAAVMATLRAAARLKLRTNIVAVAAFAENAIGPDAYLPSTIIKSLNGKSVEILNTDAEGRLVLADALTFLQRNANLKTKPNVIIDLATLTGAIMIGLGNDRAGLFSNDARLARRLMTSSVRTNEKLWPMPIGAEHTKAMKGGIADLVNAAEGRSGGSCTAAAFLQEFIEGDVRWAHLDIAGTGMGKDKATAAAPAGAPGFGVRLLIDYLRNVSK